MTAEETPRMLPIPVHRPIIETDGPVAFHDMACAVCLESKAVYHLNSGRMRPCWNCQRQGWQTFRFPRWLRWFVRNWKAA